MNAATLSLCYSINCATVSIFADTDCFVSYCMFPLSISTYEHTPLYSWLCLTTTPHSSLFILKIIYYLSLQKPIVHNFPFFLVLFKLYFAQLLLFPFFLVFWLQTSNTCPSFWWRLLLLLSACCIFVDSQVCSSSEQIEMTHTSKSATDKC